MGDGQGRSVELRPCPPLTARRCRRRDHSTRARGVSRHARADALGL